MPLFKPSSKRFPKSSSMAKDIPYVLRVEFRDLERGASTIVGKPIACFKCNAYLTDPSQIIDDEATGKHFICPFCGTLNIIEGEVLLAGDDADIVLSSPPDTSTDTSVHPYTGNSFLAVLDLSGSMSGASLAAVKRSLTSSVDSLVANSPDTVFGLIEFESSVRYRNIGSGTILELPSDSFFNFNTIVSNAEQLVDAIKLMAVGPNAPSIKRYIKSLSARGITALGPAMVFAYVIAKHHHVSRIVLLTDGLANLGIGSFEGFQAIPPKEFYLSIAKQFFEVGTTVDVVGIASSSGLEMKTLGILPDTTNGQMYYVTPNELDLSMSELAGTELLGHDVEIRIITPSGVTIRDASGLSRVASDLLKKKQATKIGSVSSDHEICIEVAPEGTLEADEVPIQVQVEYTDADGARRVRAMTTTLPVAHDESELISEMDPTVSATFVTQKAGEASFDGSSKEGRDIITTFRAALKKRAKSAPEAVRRDLEEVDLVLSEEEAEMGKIEEELEMAPPAAQARVADAAFTARYKQKRRTSKELFKKSKKKSKSK
ncbi:MAG: hypothetical protein K9W43_00575 [Candidatus Thorarchaeota archaeon]|nr:hypothetical protein [Candidatus Thorarchaeota archaeon]